jgi:hypothetical protein
MTCRYSGPQKSYSIEVGPALAIFRTGHSAAFQSAQSAKDVGARRCL